MAIRHLILAAASVLTFSGAVHAEELQPLQGHTLNLGRVAGVAYYTVEPNGFRVVATLVQGETGTPIRFDTVLAPDQTVTLSSPGEAGAALGSDLAD